MKKLTQRLVICWILLFALLGLHTLWSVRTEEQRAQQRLRELQGEAERQRAENDLLRQKLARAGEQDELERMAREQLFLVYPDEKILIDAGN